MLRTTTRGVPVLRPRHEDWTQPAAFASQITSAPNISPAAHKLHNLNFGAGCHHSLRPARLFHNPPVQFDGHTGRVNLQLLQQFEDGLALFRQVLFAVYRYRDRHVSVDTPVFNQL